MNEVFSLKRWWLLVLKHWFDHRRRYRLSIITIAGLGLAWYVGYILTQGGSFFHEEQQAAFFFTGLFLVGVVYASLLFSDLGSKAKGIAFLTLPASQFEKLLCSLFYGVIVFTVIYTWIFYTINVPAVKISNSIRYQNWLEDKARDPEYYKNKIFRPAEVVNVFVYEKYSYYEDWYETEYDYVRQNHNRPEPEPENAFLYIWLAYLAIQSFYALGSVYFGKFSLVKTSVAAIVLGLIAFFYAFFIYSVFPYSFSEGGDYLLKLVDYSKTGFVYTYRIPDFIIGIDLFLLKFLFPPLFWFIAYVRLKEKQI